MSEHLVAKRSFNSPDDEFLELWADDEFVNSTLFTDTRAPHEKPPSKPSTASQNLSTVHTVKRGSIPSTTTTCLKKPPVVVESELPSSTTQCSSNEPLIVVESASKPPTQEVTVTATEPKSPIHAKKSTREPTQSKVATSVAFKRPRVTSEVHVIPKKTIVPAPPTEQFVRKPSNRARHPSLTPRRTETTIHSVPPKTHVPPSIKPLPQPTNCRINNTYRIPKRTPPINRGTNDHRQNSNNGQTASTINNQRAQRREHPAQPHKKTQGCQAEFGCSDCNDLLSRLADAQKLNRELAAQVNSLQKQPCVRCSTRTKQSNIRRRIRQHYYREFYIVNSTEEVHSESTQ